MKYFYVFAGPNGSGKSSVVSNPEVLPLDIPGDSLYINADYYAKINPDIQNILDKNQRDAVAWHGTNEWRSKALKDGYPVIIWETVFSHPSRLEVISEAKKLGYVVILVYVTTINPEINKMRVKQRVESGGHSVSEEKIIPRYERSVGLLPDMISCADEVLVFDNSLDSSKPLLVFGKFMNKCMILNRDLQDDSLYLWIQKHIIHPLENSGGTYLILDDMLTNIVVELNYSK